MDEAQLQERVAELEAENRELVGAVERVDRDLNQAHVRIKALDKECDELMQTTNAPAQPSADVSYVTGGPVRFERCEDYTVKSSGKVYEMWKLVDGARDVRLSLTKWRRIGAAARTIVGTLELLGSGE